MKRFSSRYFLQLFRYGILFGLFPAMVIGFILYTYAYRSITQKMNDSTEQSLLHAQIRIEQALHMQDRQLFNLLTDPVTIEMISQPPKAKNFQSILQVCYNLSRTLIYDLGITDCILVNRGDDWFMDTGGMVKYSTHPGYVFYENLLRDEERNITWFTDFSKKDIQMQSFSTRWLLPDSVKLIKSYPFNSQSPEVYASISIPCTYFGSLLKADEFAKDILLIDTNGIIIANKKADLTGLSISETPYADVGDFMNADDEKVVIRGGSSNLYGYVKSDYNQWNYMYVADMHIAYEELNFLKNITICIGAVIILGVFFTAFIKSRLIYKPVENIYTRLVNQMPIQTGTNAIQDEFTVMDQQLEALFLDRKDLEEKVISQSQMGRELFVHQLLNGEITNSLLDEKVEIYQYTTYPANCCAVLLQMNFPEITTYKIEDRGWIMLAICNISTELLNDLLCFSVVIDGGDIVMALGNNESDKMQFRQVLNQTLMNLQNVIQKILHVDISIAVSNPMDSYMQFGNAAGQARSLLHYDILNSQNGLIFADDMREPVIIHPQFPLRLEENILDAIKRFDDIDVDYALRFFINNIMQSDESQGGRHLAFIRLLVDILRLAQDFDLDNFFPDVSSGSIFEQLFSIKGEQHIYTWFKNNFTDPILVQIHEKAFSREAKYYSALKEIAETKYEENLSVEQCAEILFTNPSYLRRIFKSTMGIGFNEYLTNCRIEAAKRLLSETNIRVSDIAEKLTYQNSQNFIRTFRKITGMTPGEYRKINR